MNTQKTGYWSKAPVLFGGAVCVLAVLAAASAIVGEKAAQPQTMQSTITASISAQTPSQSYEGMVSDTHCGAKHSAAINLAASDCTRTCVHSGEHFALVDGDAVYTLQGDEDSLKKLAGERVKITGTLSGNQISVASVVAE
jgi:hypothetical protein